MSLLDPIHQTHGAIVEVLALHPGMEMQELHQLLDKEHDLKISVSNLYRTVAQLVEKQVLVKEKGRISLNLVWVSHMLRFAQSLENAYIGGNLDMIELPMRDEERREFKADSLAALDPIWNHVLAKIAHLYKDPIWHEYNSHAWHRLAIPKTETALYAGLGHFGHTLYGNDTFLDRYAMKLLKNVESAITDTPPFPKEGYSLWICGDYIVDCIFPDSIARHFSFFFQTVKTIDQFDAELFADVFRIKARCSIVIRKSEHDARALRETMNTFFGKGKRKQ